ASATFTDTVSPGQGLVYNLKPSGGTATIVLETPPFTYVAPQEITFGGAPTDVVVGTTFTPSAAAPAGPVTLTVDPASASVCSMTGGVVTTLAPGGCRIH